MPAPPPPPGAVPISAGAPAPPPGAVPMGGDSTIRPMTGWEQIKQHLSDLAQSAHSPLTLLHELNRPVQPGGVTGPTVPPSMIGGVSRIAPEGASVVNALREMTIGGKKILPAIGEAWRSAAPGAAPLPPLPNTLSPEFHGPIPPVENPYVPPPNVSWTTGTRGTPPQTSEGALLKPLGEDLIPQGQAMPTAKATAAQPTVNGRPVMLDEKGNPLMYTDTAEQPIPMPGKPEAAAALKAKFEGPAAKIPTDIPERYHAHFQKLGGEVGTREAMAKDQTIANYLIGKKITPEQWEAAPTADKIKWMKEANPKYRFQSGSRSRQEADFTKHVADTMREMRPTIPPVGPAQPRQ